MYGKWEFDKFDFTVPLSSSKIDRFFPLGALVATVSPVMLAQCNVQLYNAYSKHTRSQNIVNNLFQIYVYSILRTVRYKTMTIDLTSRSYGWQQYTTPPPRRANIQTDNKMILIYTVSRNTYIARKIINLPRIQSYHKKIKPTVIYILNTIIFFYYKYALKCQNIYVKNEKKKCIGIFIII